MNVLIIGGSSDIGKSLASYLVSLGYNVIVSYCNHCCTIDRVEIVKCDIKNEYEIEDMFKYVIDKYKSIDILINLASISLDNSFFSKSKAEFMEVLEVNLVGTFLCNQIYSKYMDNGLIINMSSTDGIDTGSMYSIDYSASKAGIINMTHSISLVTNNKVLCICPNWIDSDSTRSMDMEYLNSELKRIGQSRLITIGELVDGIYKIINMNSDSGSGSVFRIDVKDDKLWIEKI